ncbi:MAG: hypothetical protein J1E01_01280 [Acetatifactor sp.]|nr:hypothetical protein [Acetatifactor sp.]
MNTAMKITDKNQESHQEVLAFNCLLTGEMRARAEVKTTLSVIDREMGKSKSVPEMDFRAGYLAGRIEEKENAGLITAEDAEQLKNVLYAKYEILRRLRI